MKIYRWFWRYVWQVVKQTIHNEMANSTECTMKDFQKFFSHTYSKMKHIYIYIYIYIYTGGSFEKRSQKHMNLICWENMNTKEQFQNKSFSRPCRPKIKSMDLTQNIILWTFFYGCTDLWPLATFSGSLSYTQSVGLLGRGISPSQGRYLHTEQQKHRINAHRHPCLEWYSNPRSQCLRGRRRFKP
jgi:hypothetical protein